MNNRNFKYISMDVIASRVTKHPLLKDINFEDIISHTVDVLRLLNVPGAYEEDSVYKDIVEYKVKLPQNNLNVKSVDLVKGDKMIPMVIGSDSHHNHLQKLNKNRSQYTGYTYTINGGMIHTNQENGKVFVVYDQLKCGDDGYPMLPDSTSLIKAIENYIKVQVFSVLVDLQKIGGGSLQRAEQEYAWYIGKAQSEFQGFINEDDTEGFLRDLKRLFPKNNTHENRHRYNVNRELRYKS